MHTPLQFSRAELFVLLGLLELPLPLALGDYPADRDPAGLGVALAAATASLAARELLLLPADPADAPTPIPALAALITDIALAEACLIHTCNRGGAPSAIHLTRRGAAYVAHSCPQPGVHRLERLPTRAALVERVTARLDLGAATMEPADLPAVTLPADVWAPALEAFCAGDVFTARAQLLAAGAPSAAVQALCTPNAPAPARHALVALRDLSDAAPQAEGAFVFSGAPVAWLGVAAAHDAAAITLTPVAAPALYARVNTLVAWLG